MGGLGSTIRVFPRKTRLTPDDQFVRFGPPGFFDNADKVEISVLFTWDKKYAEWLAEQWKDVAPVELGGPAYNTRGGVFISGRYVKEGAVITSRGCPNHCWFCSVWKREPELIELPITKGYNILDDNLLACSEKHIRGVFSMLKDQKERAQFTGGFEAKILKDWHINLLSELKPKQMFFAYDTPDDKDPLYVASLKLREAGFNRQAMRCYCLIGYPKDTMSEAENRLRFCLKCGFFPMAMLWRDNNNTVNVEWRRFQKEWSRPAIIYRKSLEVI
jgi:hypothetical protein